VLWGDLSVYEHVSIFNRLKSLSGLSTKTENEDLIAACDLAIKQDARSKTLSGGQKRYVFSLSKRLQNRNLMRKQEASARDDVHGRLEGVLYRRSIEYVVMLCMHVPS
jgi:ABC-type Na+ transport system ATPase subunit NatA